MPDVLLDGWLDYFHAGTRDCRSASRHESQQERSPAIFLAGFLACFQAGRKAFRCETIHCGGSGEVSVTFFHRGFPRAGVGEPNQSSG